MDDNNELIIYVLQQLRYGVAEQNIRATLAQNGWPQPLIDRAFSMVQQAAPHQTSPITDYATTQTNYSQPAAELPSPAETPAAALPAPEEPALQMPAALKSPRRQRKSIVRPLVITLLALVLLAGVGIGGYFIYKATHHTKTNRPTGVSSTQADEQRKQSIGKLATNLQVFYSHYHSYPTLSDINSPAFAGSKDAFDISKTHDPSWNASKSTCVDKQGRAQLADNRTSDCFSYRVTAKNGADCDASSAACTRVVLTATLSDNKPYIVALDENIKE